jgi:DNA-binding MarR family transcriptional regulator
MTQKLDEIALDAWRNFLMVHATLIERIDHELVVADCVPLHWYDVLVELVEAPNRRLRMSELASRVVLSRSTLTHLVDRMEAEGLLIRERCGTDRRGAYAVLTEQGFAALRKAWPVYARAIVHYFAQHLNSEETKMLTNAFTRVLDAARSPA